MDCLYILSASGGDLQFFEGPNIVQHHSVQAIMGEIPFYVILRSAVGNKNKVKINSKLSR